MKHLAHLLFFLLIGHSTLQSQEDTTILQESISPQGLSVTITFTPEKPVSLTTKNIVGDTLWEIHPGDEANLRISWDKEGKILYLVTNNQETDRDLWTNPEKSQNYLVMIDPRDGTILYKKDLDSQIFRYEDTQNLPPREHSFVKVGNKITISTTIEETPQTEVITLPPTAEEELARPKVTQTRASISWD